MPPPKTIDAEYESFLEEIGEKKPEPPAPTIGGGTEEGTDAEKSYEEFMAAINEGTPLSAFFPLFLSYPILVTPAKPNPMMGKAPAPFAPLPIPGQPYAAPFGVRPPFPFPPQGFPQAPFPGAPRGMPFHSPYGPPPGAAPPFGFPAGMGRGAPPPFGAPMPPWAQPGSNGASNGPSNGPPSPTSAGGAPWAQQPPPSSSAGKENGQGANGGGAAPPPWAR